MVTALHSQFHAMLYSICTQYNYIIMYIIVYIIILSSIELSFEKDKPFLKRDNGKFFCMSNLVQ